MLGDPPVLVLDEPTGGLDPEGIAWMRTMLRAFARQGRTVLVSSHVLSEVQQLVDQVVIINKGRLVRQGTLAELSDQHGGVVSVRSPSADKLAAALTPAGGGGARIERTGSDTLQVTGIPAAHIGELAFAAGVRLHELIPERGDLEEVFFALTGQTGEGPSTTGREGR
jgi:ABC-2 type transport system ATP-binding protein